MTILPPATRLGRSWRLVLSAAIAFHCIAVFAPPLAFQARGPLGNSPSVEALGVPGRGYGEFLYLNRGYAFFAPDPGPSHLIQAEIVAPDGARSEPMYPDLSAQWPRLLYHRHFMLAEFLSAAYQPPEPPPELEDLNPDEYRFWLRSRSRYEQIRESIVDHLRATHPNHEVAIRRLEHGLPDFIEFNRETIQLDAPELYRVLLDVVPELDSPAEAGPDTSAPDTPNGRAHETTSPNAGSRPQALEAVR